MTVADVDPELAYVMADKLYRELAAKSMRLTDARRALPPGSSRARVTTANARWARTAEARDIRERQLRAEFQRLKEEPQP